MPDNLYPAVAVRIVNVDTPETVQDAFMMEIRRQLRNKGLILECREEQQVWTVLLHVPGQRLDTARVLQCLHETSTQSASCPQI